MDMGGHMPDVYYFVVWERIDKRTFKATNPSNTILRNIHPVEWAARRIPKYDEYFLTTLLFWAEIPEATARAADDARWTHIES
jgi:hypothetical protein